jgi:hypothetical protein
MTLTKQELLDLLEEVQEAKSSTSELKGQQTAIKKQLKDDFGCNSLETAEEEIDTMNKKLTIYDKKIKKGSEELESQLNEEEEEEEE